MDGNLWQVQLEEAPVVQAAPAQASLFHLLLSTECRGGEALRDVAAVLGALHQALRMSCCPSYAQDLKQIRVGVGRRGRGIASSLPF